MEATTHDHDARRRIRRSLHESLIVEAAAGTGKTTELIHRILEVLRTGRTTVDKIVAVTFTRKAAGELRLRLRVELDRARLATTDPNEIAYLEHALARLEEAHLGTIHSFCAELLRQRPVEARLPPGFEEIDESQSLRLYSRAFDLWIQQRLQQMTPALRRTISRFSLERANEDNSPIARLRQAGLDVVAWRDFRQAWRREPFHRDAEAQELAVGVEALAHIASGCAVRSHPLREHLQPAVDFTSRMRRAEEIGRRDMDELEALLVRLSRQLGKRPRTKGAKAFSPTHSRDEVLEIMNGLVEQLSQFAERADADLAALLQAEMQELIDVYEEMKDRSGKVDFVDLLVRTRDVIRDDSGVRQLLQERFTHIFVDEFQDTDPVQAEILLLLASDDPDENDWRKLRPLPGKLFLVGDPKQSIYRFRRADIILYQEVCANLKAKGVDTVYLSHSFRALKPIQDAVNAAFAPEIQRNEATGQPDYVDLDGGAPESDQPAVIALPVPRPYGAYGNVTNDAINKCLPDAIAAFVDWLIRRSGWTVRDPGGSGARAPLESQHIAILFKRFMSWGDDVTRNYVHALEARNIPHQLWQARSFHQREEVETIRAALNAIEWPDDELSVFATLKGSLFAIPDNLLLRFRSEVGSFRPFRPLPDDLHTDFHPIRDALAAIADLHRGRNRRAAVETVNAALEMVRAHAAFAMRPSGNQVLANVYHISNLARAYELGGGYSFRGFVEQLNQQSETEDSAEAPIVEEGSEGVRIMTVHAAKGLEFPVVILADITANPAPREPARHIDAEHNLCAVRVANCAPWELTDHSEEEHERDLAEGVRVAYVAATRARDLLVVPAVGDREFRGGWLASLNKSLYPAREQYREAKPAPACPAFGDASVLSNPNDYEGTGESSIRPGVHTPHACSHSVVWWDPALLDRQAEGSFGLRQEGILGEGPLAEPGREKYQSWKSSREQSLNRGHQPSLNVFIATEGFEPPPGYAALVQVERMERDAARPKGPRFGSLVHLVLKDVDFTASPDAILQLARTHARLLNAPVNETEAAAEAVAAALKHPLLQRAARAARCHRELPILIQDEHLGVLDAVIDLAFREDSVWTVVDFKTDADDIQRTAKYRRQVGWYVHSLQQTTGLLASGYLLHV